MWKVAVVQPVTEGFGFNITTETNVPLVSFAYATRAEAEAAATHAQAADGSPGFDGHIAMVDPSRPSGAVARECPEGSRFVV